MKKEFIILVFSFLIFSFQMGYAQSSDAINSRVLDIKKWYQEIQTIGLKNCLTKEKKVEEVNSDEKEEFTNTIKKCQLNEIYQINQGVFNGYEWNSNISVYRKNNKIFFVYIEIFSLSGHGQYRFYFNDKELLIKQVDKVDDVIRDKVTNKENKENLLKNTTQVFKKFEGCNEVINFRFED